MFPLGLSTSGKVVEASLFRAYREAGIELMEFSTAQEAYADLDFRAVAAMAAAHGITLWSMHLPFKPFSQIDLSAPDAALREGSVAFLSTLIRRAADASFLRYTVHPSAVLPADANRAERMALAKDSLRQLSHVAVSCGGTLMVENMIPSCLGRSSAEMLELLSAAPELRSVFDTNHLIGENPVEYIHALGSRLLSTHVSDYDGVWEKHWLPGEGCGDFQGIIKALTDVGYPGPWLYEVSFKSSPTLAQPRPRDLTCADFVENARALFRGETPPRIV